LSIDLGILNGGFITIHRSQLGEVRLRIGRPPELVYVIARHG